MNKIVFLFLTFLTLLCQGALFALQQVGEVIAVDGTVKAIADNNKERDLKRGSALYLHDVVSVAEDGKAQIKFSDGGLINLIPSTEFRVDTYAFNTRTQKGEFTGDLLKGGFRAVSGSIAKENPSSYQVKTPVATIGVRGTIYEARIVMNQVLYGCELGNAVITTNAGKVVIGAGKPNQFAQVSSINAAPKLLSTRPTELSLKLFASPAGGQSLEAAQSKAQEGKASKSGEVEVSADEGKCP